MIVWLRDSRLTVLVMAYSLIVTICLMRVQRDNARTAATPQIQIERESKSASMNALVASKSATQLEGGLGYEYESGKKCPYKWHGGAPNDQMRGSCWCGLDSYCMCTPSLAIDAIIEVPGEVAKPGQGDNEPYIVVVRRKDPPKDKHAIPGGFVDVGETVEQATVREVKEETNLNVAKLEQFHVYSDPKRDKRRHTVSAVFRCIVNDLSTLQRGDDAKGVDLIRLRDLIAPGNDENLAFDHALIFKDFAARFHSTLTY